ncbi:trypsin-like peptidase domain-containing protein [Nocardia sp. NBC_00565]|uniref:bifunctional trypsin-like peptidase domain-containing/SEL1-like repeat protein n=1 Tax=Nocardia sp. NBC_00565 TaxID=2975993 RepID=UPI002E813C2C|nr:bifunctional trypsin-like peptidase domain-containing/SEL1-like repeat protein [Nocardia sp. NBC_00565]WUC04810.1 trypsin-like peptidase domain-containing protein [Nocardia sp. NBC_00565]
MTASKSDSSAVRLDHVVAVVVSLPGNRSQVGSGFLIAPRLVVTARHCTRNKLTGQYGLGIRVIRASDGKFLRIPNSSVSAAPDLDIAVIRLPEHQDWSSDTPQPELARVRRDVTGILSDCVAVGFPIFQRDPKDATRQLAELHGIIYQLDGVESNYLLMREPLVRPVLDAPQTSIADRNKPYSNGTDRRIQEPAWGGLSGAVVFHANRGIGVIVEHHPRQGESALRLIGFDRIAASSNPVTQAISEALGISHMEHMPWAMSIPVRPLHELVEVLAGDLLPYTKDLDPYRLGATVSPYGDSESYIRHDPYVPRTYNDVDTRIRDAVRAAIAEETPTDRIILLAGPSKAGKTRSLYEAIRSVAPNALLVSPVPGEIDKVAEHPAVQTTLTDVVIWLDDLQRYLTHERPITNIQTSRFNARAGHTAIVATLRLEELARLRAATGEPSRDLRLLLDRAIIIELLPTTADPNEQTAAEGAYPNQDLTFGLGAHMAGAPVLLGLYRAAEFSDPYGHALLTVAIDWVRVGVPHPIDEATLITYAKDTLRAGHPELDADEQTLRDALKRLRVAPESAARVGPLSTIPLDGNARGYDPFDYLVAADDGQSPPARPIPENFWMKILDQSSASVAFAIGSAAYLREKISVAIAAFQKAAEDDHTAAMVSLGALLSELPEPKIVAARYWSERAASLGESAAMHNLGNLFAYKWEPADLKLAKKWWRRAIAAGEPHSAFDLAILLSEVQSPPDLVAARRWYEYGALSGDTNSMVNLGNLLSSKFDPPDIEAAKRWYLTAAQAGVPVSMHNLAHLLANQSTPPDLEGARGWYQHAAEAGHPPAMTNLGGILSSLGRYPEAQYWYERAVENGESASMHNLGMLFATRKDAPDLVSAETWYERAALAGDTRSMTNLGALKCTLLEPPDFDGARTWFERAAELGDTGAMCNLGYLLLSNVEPPDIISARSWVEKAARLGDRNAMTILGQLLAYYLAPPDLVTAQIWWERAAEYGDRLAMQNLANLFESVVDPPDPAAARLWLERATKTAEGSRYSDSLKGREILLPDLPGTVLDPTPTPPRGSRGAVVRKRRRPG